MLTTQKVAECHHGLADELSRFTADSALALSGALYLFPSLQRITPRLEVLTALCAMCCNGAEDASFENLHGWVMTHLSKSPFIDAESTPQDVFIDNISTSWGNFRVCVGSNYGVASELERLLNFSFDIIEKKETLSHVASSVNLLKLSDLLLDRHGAKRYRDQTTNNEVVEHEFLISRDLCNLTSLIVTTDELKAAQIDVNALGGFFLSNEDRRRIGGSMHLASTLTNRPLLRIESGLIVYLPSRIVMCSYLNLLSGIRASSYVRAYSPLFQVQNANHFLHLCTAHLSIDRKEFRPPVERPTINLFPWKGHIGGECTVLGLIWTAELSTGIADGEALQASMETLCEAVAQEPGFEEGLILLATCTHDQSFPSRMLKTPANWSLHRASLAEWDLLAMDSKIDALLLWSLSDQLKLLQQSGVTVYSDNSLLELVSFWMDNGYKFFRQGFTREWRGIKVIFALGDAWKLASRVKNLLDRHVHWMSNGIFHFLVRKSRKLGSEALKDSIYGSERAARNGALVGCAEHGGITWWVVALQDKREVGPQSHVLYILWECVLTWAAKMIDLASERWAVLKQKQVLIKVDVVNLANWDKEKRKEEDSTDRNPIAFQIDREEFSIRLRILETFVDESATASNAAEENIVRQLFAAIGDLTADAAKATFINKLTKRVVENAGQRYFHVFEGDVLEYSGDSGRGSPDPEFVRDAEVAGAELRLVISLKQYVGKPMESKEVALQVLHDAVAFLWTEIENELKPASHHTVVHTCLSGMAELQRDSRRWKISTRALLSMDTKLEATSSISERISDQEAGVLFNRLIMETAQYCSRTDNGIALSKPKYFRTLGIMKLLCRLAGHREAISGDFLDYKFTIFSDGSISIDENFYSETVLSYLSERHKRLIEKTAEDYETSFGGKSSSENISSLTDAEVASFHKAFQSEFGFPAEKLAKLLDVVRNLANRDGKAIWLWPRAEFDGILVRQAGFSKDAAASFIDRFTLPVRRAWNKDLPARASENDVYPWKFRRQLSLLIRPIIACDKKIGKVILSGALLKASIRYLTGNLMFGRLPAEAFKSEEMKAYVGDRVDKLGKAFGREVGQVFRELGLEVHLEIQMTQLGGEASAGDVDVIGFHTGTRRVYLVECKRLIEALTVGEIAQRLSEFKGDKQARDALGKHLLRVDWLRANPSGLATLLKQSVTAEDLHDLLVTSDLVPMAFCSEINIEPAKVLAFDRLKAFLTSGLQN